MKKIIYTTFVAAGLALSSCNDSFMERYQDTQLTEETSFSNYNTFKTYAWGLYEVFTNNNILRYVGSNGYGSFIPYWSDVYAGYLMERQGGGNPYAFQNISSKASGNGWNFDYVRRVNVMLANIDQSPMNDTDKEHWRSVGYFFRAYYYMELIARFGDVPWVDHTLSETDKEVAYGKRTPRKTVADNVLNDLIYAEEHIKEAGDGDNTINTNVVRALISRFALFEGTWRKYHDLGDYEKYFDACIKYSEPLMKAYPDLHSDWGEMMTSNLANMKGIILYKEYVPSEEANYAMHLVERTASHAIEMPQHIVDMYLCTDGKPISTSTEYEWDKNGDKSMYATFRNRDRRLLETVAPPYKVINNGNASWDYVEGKREYMDILGVTTKTGYGGGNGEAGKHKVFPMMNWAGNILPEVPHFFTNSGGVGFCVAKSGNYVWRLYNVWDNSLENKADADIPLFKIDEVLLNYAEAKWEKGEFTNDVAHITINKLRRQFGRIADMDVNAINEGFDKDRDQTVDPVLWEIRRERMIELMGEGFGFYDVRRWKKAEWFVNKVPYGQWTTKEQIGESGTFIDLSTGLATTNTNQTEGYVYMYNDPVKSGKGWLDKYYLYQIPTNEIALNPNLLPNNPGW